GHLGDQMHAALRRGAAQGRARADGPRFLVLRTGAQPQGAGDVPAPSSCAGTVGAAAHAGGTIPSLHARELHDLAGEGMKAPASLTFTSAAARARRSAPCSTASR